MLGKKIYELRKKLNISQEEFAIAINTSRQSISKWELGDAYPEINKLKDIASFFNVSIDYLLGYDVNNSSCTEFLNKLEYCINNKDFTISVNEIKSMVAKFSNNFRLYVYSSSYLFALELEKNERNLFELIISYYKKAISLYNSQDSSDISLHNLNLAVIEVHVLYKKYDLAMEYMEQNKIYDNRLLAECNYRFKKYDEASAIVSKIYLSAISDIISSAHMQIRILIKDKNIHQAYELTNWVLNLIDSTKSKKEIFSSIQIIYMYLKAVCERIMNINYVETVNLLKSIVGKGEIGLDDSDSFKFYYGEKVGLYSDAKDTKKRIQEEILEDKDENFDLYNEIYKEVYGGSIDE